MYIFGWIMLSLLGIFGASTLIVFALPYMIIEIKSLKYKIEKAFEDIKSDIDKRSEERKNRYEIKRNRDFELANKKLDFKLQKVDKQIQLHQKKLILVKELKNETEIKKENLNKTPEIITKKIISKPKQQKIIEEPIEDIKEIELEEIETNNQE